MTSKNENTLPLPEGTPSSRSWILAITSTALVAGGLLIFYHLSHGLVLAYRQQEFQAALLAAKTTEEIFQVENYSPFLHPKDRTTRTIVELTSALEAREFERALANYTIAEQIGEVVIPGLKPKLETLKIVTDQIGTSRKKEAELTGTGKDLQERYRLAEGRLRTSLGLSQGTTLEEDFAEHEVYADGVLNGLPLLTEIPTSPETEGTLVGQLGGKSAIFPDGTLTNQQRQELEALRADVAALLKEVEQWDEHLANAEAATAALELKQTEEQKETIRLARQELIGLARPEVSPLTRRIYHETGKLVARWNVVLPPL